MMRIFFFGTLVLLLILSVVAWRIQPSAENDGKIPLVWVSDDNPARRDQVGLFNTMNPQCLLSLDPGNSAMEKVIVQALGGVGPDLFDCYDGYQLSAYVRSGVAWDVTEEFKRLKLDVGSIWEPLKNYVFYDNRVYGFGTNIAADAIWINKDIFDAEGVPYPKGPWKWDEFIKLAQRMTKRDAKGRVERFGFMCEWWNWLHFVYQWGGRVYTPDGTRCVADSPETIAAVQFMHDLIYKYKVIPSPVEEAAMATQGGWGSGVITRFGASKAAMALGGRWWLCTLRDYKNLRLGVAESPYSQHRIFRAYGKATLINRHSPRREEALRFLAYQATKEYNDLINGQADGIGPVVKHTYSDAFLHNPKFPEEDQNAVWREAALHSKSDQISPFVNGQVASRLLSKQLDLVKSNQKSPAEAMRTAAEQINAEIQKTLAQDPALRKRYEELTKQASVRGTQ
jgi:multiple sugar transport system substrate-binding protein